MKVVVLVAYTLDLETVATEYEDEIMDLQQTKNCGFREAVRCTVLNELKKDPAQYGLFDYWKVVDVQIHDEKQEDKK